MKTNQVAVYLFVYNSFALFEIAPAAFILTMGKAKVVVLGQNQNPILSAEGLRVQPDTPISNIHSSDADALIIPGGTIANIEKIEQVLTLVRDMDERGRVLAAICAGPGVLAKAGVLSRHKFTTSLDAETHEYLPRENMLEQDLVMDGNVITAKPYANVEFGLAIARSLNLLGNDGDYEQVAADLRRSKEKKAGI